ncbi:hypothetical protein KC19_5G085400 [Ceratodon purpureus]|uniref:Uncharacterized protein n=1 Tax=Ceratodon purpureus TaxID=3225 RepID=A0A8T0I0V0_CERPU|nr:hypothetical protein KC19_5G085400 [Ceratodon purpureus]
MNTQSAVLCKPALPLLNPDDPRTQLHLQQSPAQEPKIPRHSDFYPRVLTVKIGTKTD